MALKGALWLTHARCMRERADRIHRMAGARVRLIPRPARGLETQGPSDGAGLRGLDTDVRYGAYAWP